MANTSVAQLRALLPKRLKVANRRPGAHRVWPLPSPEHPSRSRTTRPRGGSSQARGGAHDYPTLQAEGPKPLFKEKRRRNQCRKSPSIQKPAAAAGVRSGMELRAQQEGGRPLSGGRPPASAQRRPRGAHPEHPYSGSHPEHPGAGEAWGEAGAAPRHPREAGGPARGAAPHPTPRPRKDAGPSVPVIEGMLLAEIPKVLLLLLGQRAEQLALAAAAAFPHREKASSSALQSRASHRQAVPSAHQRALAGGA